MTEITKEEQAYFDQVEPIEARIIVKRDTSGNRIILTGEGGGKFRPSGTVVAAGPACRFVKKGDKVFWSSTTLCEIVEVPQFKENEDTEGKYAVVPETYVAYRQK